MTDEQKEAQIKAEAKVKAEANAKAEADAKAQAKIDAQAKARAKLEEEAKTLGIKPSKCKMPPHSKLIKNMPAEIVKHEELYYQRLANRIAKAKVKVKVMPAKAARKQLITARLKHTKDYQKGMVAQWRWELRQMAANLWRPGQRMPKKPTEYQKIMDED